MCSLRQARPRVHRSIMCLYFYYRKIKETTERNPEGSLCWGDLQKSNHSVEGLSIILWIISIPCFTCFNKVSLSICAAKANLKSPQTVRNYCQWCRCAAGPDGSTTRGLSVTGLKINIQGVSEVAITPEMLHCMYDHVDGSSVTDLVIWAAILIAFFCLLRKSNYVPDSQKSFDKSKQLCREDIAVGPDCLVVHIKWSKTIEMADKTIHIPVLAIPNSPICPVKAYQRMIDEVPACLDDPAFSVPTKKRQPAFDLPGPGGLGKWCIYGILVHSPRRTDPGSKPAK